MHVFQTQTEYHPIPERGLRPWDAKLSLTWIRDNLRITAEVNYPQFSQIPVLSSVYDCYYPLFISIWAFL